MINSDCCLMHLLVFSSVYDDNVKDRGKVSSRFKRWLNVIPVGRPLLIFSLSCIHVNVCLTSKQLVRVLPAKLSLLLSCVWSNL